MRALEASFVMYLFNSLWQVPLVFAAAWIAARLAHPAGPRIEHRIWVSALLLEVILPACRFDLANVFRSTWELIASLLPWTSSESSGHTRIILGPVTASGTSALHLSATLIASIVAAYALALLYFTGRLAWGLWKTHRMMREAQPIPQYNIQPQVSIATSPAISGPVTVGIRQPMLLVPPGFLEQISENDRDAVLAHEYAHIERHDFAKNLLYGAISLPIAYHPVLWLTTSRLAVTREMICDEMAASTITGRELYVRSLLRLASMLSDRAPARTIHAIGIFDANIFERRIMNLAHKRTEIHALRRLAIAAACAVVAIATCASALALRMEVTAQNEHPNPKMIHVKAEALKLVSQVRPVYPPKAKEAGIQGSVVLHALISKEGVPTELKIQSGPRELQSSALDAVHQWRYQPFLLNGEPIEVDTTITVAYTLGK
jgi:TonB family protein